MKKLVYVFLILVIVACKKDDASSLDLDPIPTLTDEVEIYEHNLVDRGLVLAVQNGSDECYILDKAGNKKHTWNFSDRLGNDFELLENGKSVAMFKDPEPAFTFGGFGGVIKMVNPNSSIDWEFKYSSENYIAHHDVELLPNGNILFLVWEKIDSETAKNHGVNFENPIFPEKLVEVNPVTQQIVWEWRSWDHIIQDFDENKLKYGSVKDNPQLIDINYNLQANGDFMHANGIDYDEKKDVIYMSVNFFSEVWVIDHSTSTEQAASNAGGTYGKGGDLLYRFGNPGVYRNTMGERIFFRNHFPNLLENGEPGEGNLLIYVNNGDGVDQSTVYEFAMPNSFSLVPGANNEPSIVWSYTNKDLHFGRISGAVRLQNGNTLICEGDFGFWEITPDKEIAWKYNGGGESFWRAYSYQTDDDAIRNLGL